MKNHSVTTLFSALSVSILLVATTCAKAQTSLTAMSNKTSLSTMNASDVLIDQPAQVIKTFLTAVQKGDHPTAKALIDPNIQWNQPGTNRFSGLKKSSDAVVHMVGGMIQASSQTLSLADIKQLTVNGNKVACLVRWKAVMPGGGVLDVHNIDVYTVEKGKIVEAMIYSEDIAQEDEFWGK
ncbi:nuclear transport factor 2 family protein [Spirosoma sp. BT702]|uniref:Nuclear transport factor 2 family protein n=1 Tax=Spirosoma profusum TaxID=2771354 RepID=A0A926Y1M6_9BACT|nr:nuclear transport factor 2 family protein [Spirosoma profusum]MBD2700206.1 nuclear transport factor 2 family protein [Spirosoma profusum]